MLMKLIEFRKDRGLASNEIAKTIGISASFYEKIERGDRNPSYNFIILFKKAFPNSRVDEIFFDKRLHVRRSNNVKR